MKYILIFVDKKNKRKIYFEETKEVFYITEYLNSNDNLMFFIVPFALVVFEECRRFLDFDVPYLVGSISIIIFIMIGIYYIRKNQNKNSIGDNCQCSMKYLSSEISIIKRQYRGNLGFIFVGLIFSVLFFILYTQINSFVNILYTIMSVIACILLLKDYDVKKVKKIINYIEDSNN